MLDGPDIIMHQLKSNYNSPFKDSYSHPIYTCFAMIASNGTRTLYFDVADFTGLVHFWWNS